VAKTFETPVQAATQGGRTVLSMATAHTESSTMAACVAQVVGVAASEVPLEVELLRPWLAERGLGLVPVADAASFGWAGPWIDLRPAIDG
jgi:hypothetical protein